MCRSVDFSWELHRAAHSAPLEMSTTRHVIVSTIRHPEHPEFVMEAECSQDQPKPSRKHWPCFTLVVMLACTVMMAFELHENAAGVDFEGAPTPTCWFRFELSKRGFGHFCAARLSKNPFFGPSTEVLLKFGGVDRRRIVEDGEVWRLATALFLPAGAAPWGVSLLAQLGISRQLENSHGPLRVGPIYLLSGLFGAIASASFAPEALSVGAGGAIFGVVGACVGDVLLNFNTYRRPCCTVFAILLLSLFQLLLGTMPLVDNFAHTFGFAMGLISSLVLLKRLNPGKACAATCCRGFMRLIVGCCVLVLLVTGVGLMYNFDGHDATEFCSQCSRISCLPFPWGCDAQQPGACWWNCSIADLPEI